MAQSFFCPAHTIFSRSSIFLFDAGFTGQKIFTVMGNADTNAWACQT
jgi:hypothetical protein